MVCAMCVVCGLYVDGVSIFGRATARSLFLRLDRLTNLTFASELLHRIHRTHTSLVTICRRRAYYYALAAGICQSLSLSIPPSHHLISTVDLLEIG